MRLRYVHDDIPGFTRKKKWGSFSYFDEEGRKIRDREIVKRISSLGIPPAYTDVWICPFAHGHLQATGRDARGRKQYVYHADWTAQRDETKFHRMLLFARALSPLRRRVAKDMRRRGMPREKVIAAIVRLLDTTYVRIGNEEYAKEHGSFGLTTLQNRHVKGTGMTMKLVFRGKHGIVHEVPLEDDRLRAIVRTCHDIPGHELFAYLDEEGRAKDVKSEDVNAYLQEISGEEITAKDFRTWHGTVLAAACLWQHAFSLKKHERRMRIKQAVTQASQALGNTAAICKKCYIHPLIFTLYEHGTLQEPKGLEATKKRFPFLIKRELQVVKVLEKVSS